MMRAHLQTIRGLPLFQGATLEISPLEGGMTNHNYLVHAPGGSYVARFAPASTSALGLSRAREIRNHKAAHAIGLASKVVAHYPAERLLVVEYLPGRVMTSGRVREPQMIGRLGKMLKTLHRRAEFSGAIDQIRRARRYVQAVKEAGGWRPAGFEAAEAEFARAVRAIHPLPAPRACHLDLMLENILVTPSGLPRLLDWEYSSCADYRYDLAMLSVKGRYRDTEERMLARAYGQGGREYLRARTAMKIIVHFAEAAYGILQDRLSRKTAVDYRGYARENVEGLMRLARRGGE